MQRSSAAITLVLIGTAAVLTGYEAVQRHETATSDNFDSDDTTGGDYDGSDALYPTTGPTTRSSSNRRGYSSHYLRQYWYSSGGGGTYQGGSSSSYPSSGTSGARSGTSRGGFGASGHAAS